MLLASQIRMSLVALAAPASPTVLAFRRIFSFCSIRYHLTRITYCLESERTDGKLSEFYFVLLSVNYYQFHTIDASVFYFAVSGGANQWSALFPKSRGTGSSLFANSLRKRLRLRFFASGNNGGIVEEISEAKKEPKNFVWPDNKVRSVTFSLWKFCLFDWPGEPAVLVYV